MNNVLRTLKPEGIAVDIGCGPGSFNYASYECRIIGLDVDMTRKSLFRDGKRIEYVAAKSHEIPLADESADAVICNHSLEHISELRRTLMEIRRILKPAGLLWISVPNGFGLDDGLYRMLYSGGGHVNRFTFGQIKNIVEATTGLKLLQSNILSSGFVYCNPPETVALKYLPRRLRLIHALKPLGDVILFLLNGATRLIDRVAQTHLSMYGWGFVFGKPGTSLEALPSYFNVCSGCGAGTPFSQLTQLKKWGAKFYDCVYCKRTNLLFRPPPGFV